MDEFTYNAIKSLESSVQSLLFALPMKDSRLYKDLRLDSGEEWKMGSLIDNLIWLRDKAKNAATAAYMQGKE